MSTIIDLGKLRFQFRGSYAAATQYEYNDVVLFGGDVFCYINVTATIGNDPTSATHWSKMMGGLAATGEWDAATQYQINDLATHGGSLYRATAASLNVIPPNGSNWELIAGGYRFRQLWAIGATYEVNESVVHEGSSYRALTNHTAGVNFLTDFLAGNWERYSQGTYDKGQYANSSNYFKGDLVQVGVAPNLDHYICLTDHESDASADPGTSPEDANWTRLISGQYTSTVADRQYAFFVGTGC